MQRGDIRLLAPLPTNLVAPTVSIPTYEVGAIATVDPGIWVDASEFHGQWHIRGVLIPGAVGLTYQLLGSELGGIGSIATEALFADASGFPPLTCAVYGIGTNGTSAASTISSNSVSFSWSQYASQVVLRLDESAIASSAGRVDSWTNQGAVAAVYSHTGANRPATGTLAGWAAVDFDNPADPSTQDKFLRATTVHMQDLVGANPTNVIAWMVADWRAFDVDSSASGRPAIISDVGGSKFILGTQRNNAGSLSVTNTVTGVTNTETQTNNVLSETGLHVQECRLHQSQLMNRWDGVDNTASPGALTAVTNITAVNGTRIGAETNVTVNHALRGVIGTVVLWNSAAAITPTQINTIRAVLKGKYGALTGIENPANYVAAVALISSANTYSSSLAGRPTGSAYFTAALVWRKTTAAATSMVRNYSAARGTTLTSTTRTGFLARVRDNAAVPGSSVRFGTAIGRADTTTLATDAFPLITQNAIQRTVVVYDNGVVYMYLNGVLVKTDNQGTLSVPAGVTGYNPPVAEAFLLASASASVTDEFELVSMGFADDVALSAAEVAAWDAVVAAKGSRAFAGADFHWEGEDAGSTWTDRIAGHVLTRTGSLAVARKFVGIYS